MGANAGLAPTTPSRGHRTSQEQGAGPPFRCVAFGSDPVKFANFVPVNRQQQVADLSNDRADVCVYDYDALKRSFVNAILKPHVDSELQKQVLAAKWLETR